jgi:hypothetical protein
VRDLAASVGEQVEMGETIMRVEKERDGQGQAEGQ